MSDKKEWLEWRKQGIGGSDIAAILGLSPWKTPLQVYLDKTSDNVEVTEENEAMLWGNILEGVVLAEFEKRFKTEAHGSQTRYVEDCRIATIDGMAVVDDIWCLLEVKTARTAQGWGESGTTEIPLHYQCQVQHYLSIANLQRAYVVVLIGGSDFRTYPIEADPEVGETLKTACEEFWNSYVVPRTPPPPTSYAEAVQLFAESTEGTLESDDEISSVVEQAKAIQAEVKAKQEELDALKGKIGGYLGDLSTLTRGGKPLVTWNSGTRTSLDLSALKTAHPDLYKQFEKSSPTRTMLFK
jgi:putative phage-type endonuclease